MIDDINNFIKKNNLFYSERIRLTFLVALNGWRDLLKITKNNLNFRNLRKNDIETGKTRA